MHIEKEKEKRENYRGGKKVSSRYQVGPHYFHQIFKAADGS